MITTPSVFVRFSKFVLVWIFLVIIAGAVVRMTQSGMGCPDWPRCFGKWIPPTNASELPPDFEKYLRQQDIDHTFNAFHTWTEYINRLMGALLGLLLLAQLAWSIKLFWQSNRRVVWTCMVTVLLTGFQGWLGKKVVDANLATVKITTHMMVALLIAGLALTVIYLAGNTVKKTSERLSNLSLLALALLTVQIVMGTDVREQVDEISKQLNYGARELWIEKLNTRFLVHRSFSLLIAAVCVYLFFQFKKAGHNQISIQLALICVAAEIILGAVMAYCNIPAAAQPLHLLFSSILFSALYYCWLSTAAVTNRQRQ